MTVGTLVLVAGSARGEALVLTEPLSFWGGTDPAGRITDRRHPQHGAHLAGRVLVMPFGRGSSSSSSVLAEAIRTGTAPAAIVLSEPDPILPLGAIVAQELYGQTVPIVVLAQESYGTIRTGDVVTIAADEQRADPLVWSFPPAGEPA
ncbi:MAG: aconitase X swivel domain-containing protein [Actinomycetota bacterium]